ncbi:MAG: glycosyl hydrolase family 39 [Candidatus Sulfotelmatobacter sp.]
MTQLLRAFILAVLLTLSPLICSPIIFSPIIPPLYGQSASGNSDVILVDAKATAHPFPHFWEKMFGSGRAILSLRENYRDDLRAVKQITDLNYVRFHAILDDEVGVYSEDAQEHAVYNFSYVDQIYDGLLASGVRPFVEISFMPNQLAASHTLQAFWYHPNVSPTKDWGRWDGLVAAFARHLVERYGIDEVSQWYFEVWNEPNLDFWAGQPRQETYWGLYDHTATTIKKVSPRLRVGGPATAQAAWVDAFIRHCAEKQIPLDYVSTHVYANDTAQDVFGTQENIPRDRMVCRAVDKVHRQIKSSSMPNLPLIWSEFNASYKNETDVTDSIYMGPWMADTIRQCDGLVDMMSYWTLSDVFEEQGVVKTPFYGGYGLIAEDDIPKPAFNAFKLLHQLGDERIQLDSNSALLTRREDGTLVLAVWNYAPPGQSGSAKTITIRVTNSNAKHANVSRVDADHGDVHGVYEKMGGPRYPTQKQIVELRRAAELPAPEVDRIEHGEFTITLPSHGLAVIEVK